jgi:hypothetical protein
VKTALEPVKFHFREQTEKNLGFVAEDVPEVVAVAVRNTFVMILRGRNDRRLSPVKVGRIGWDLSWSVRSVRRTNCSPHLMEIPNARGRHLLRADSGIYRHKRHVVIYRGLIVL